MIIGIDTGGTFTDVVILRDGAMTRFKVPSTPDDPSTAFAAALAKVGGLFPGEDLRRIVYGATVATNALLEGKLADTCFVTNAGFEDIFRLGRQNRYPEDLYSPNPGNRNVPVDRKKVFGLDVRQGPNGEMIKELTPSDISDLIVALDDAGASSVGIGLLHSHSDSSVEEKIASVLEKAGFAVCTSSGIDPNPYEYERFVTTAVNAGLIPVMRHSFESLVDVSNVSPMVMQSSGGVGTIDEVSRYPVRLLFSGPAGGVMGLEAIAKWTGGKKLIGFDMGGTSTDVSIYDHAPRYRQQIELAGLTIRTPSVDIQSVGAGGGSIVSLSKSGMLSVGPESAGAQPGPACYGNKGPLTLTDCNLLAGRLPVGIMLAGDIPLDVRLSENALAETCDGKRDPAKMVQGAIKVGTAVMAGAIRKAARESGVDPSEFALVAFGGAGGLHAVDLAREVGIKKVIIPKDAGVFSAMGIALSRPRTDRQHYVGITWERNTDGAGIIQSVKTLLPETADGEEIQITARCRYPGQRFTLEIPFGENLPARFDTAHEKHYRLSRDDVPVEIVSVIISLLGPAPDFEKPSHIPGDSKIEVPANAISWDGLEVGQNIPGPQSVITREQTAWIPENHLANVDDIGSLVIEVSG